jgi:hypothetical protein
MRRRWAPLMTGGRRDRPRPRGGRA